METNDRELLKWFFRLILTLIFGWYICMCAGCSTQKRIASRLNHANKDFEKAEKLGHVFEKDTLKTLNKLPSVPLELSPVQINIIMSKVDTEMEKAGEPRLTEGQRKVVQRIIEETPKYINLDTLITFENGSKYHLVINKGVINPDSHFESVCVEKKPIIVPCNCGILDSLGIDRTYEKVLFWLALIIGLALFLWRLIKP